MTNKQIKKNFPETNKLIYLDSTKEWTVVSLIIQCISFLLCPLVCFKKSSDLLLYRLTYSILIRQRSTTTLCNTTLRPTFTTYIKMCIPKFTVICATFWIERITASAQVFIKYSFQLASG